jgi:hypothetical protein
VQAKPNADKADQASPFAMLLDTVSSKDAVRDANQPPQKDASNSTDKGADDKSAQAGDDQDAAIQTASSTPPKPSQASKPEKSDKDKDKDQAKASDDTDPQVPAPQAQDQQVAEQAIIQMQPQNVPVPPAVAQTAIAADGESDGLAVDAAAALTPQADMKAAGNGKAEAKPGPKADTRAAAPANAPVKPAVTAEAAAVADDGGEESADMPIAAPVGQAVAAKTDAPAQKPDIANIQTAAAANDRGKPAQNGGPKNTDALPQDTAQKAAPQDVAPKDIAAKTDTGDAAADNAGKSAGVKNTVPKSRATQADLADAAKGEAPKADAAKTVAPQPDATNVADAPKADPHPAGQAIFAINSIAAPQGAQSSPVATAIANAHAHVQVTAQAEPNLPALAVEIAGRSKSGTKQFDIRLDPPELGRVEVRLSIDATGKASAHLSADQPQTLNLLQKDAPVLTRALRDAGLDVSQDGLNFSLRQQNENSSGNAGSNGRRGSSRSFPLSASISIDATAGSAAYRAAANGRLDIRV